MANKKYHYYVLVFTNEGPKYVTALKTGKYAEWKTENKPLEMSASWAEEIYKGLNLNFHLCVLVKSVYEIDTHPYNYNDFKLNFEKKENKES